MNPSLTAASPDVFKRAGLRETAVLLALAWAVPFLVHLAPWSGERPLGVYLLPLFWTAFVATYFYGAVIGVAVGLFAPAINLLMTGLPVSRYAAEATLELIVYAFVVAWVVRRMPRIFFIAPVGFIVARLAWAEWQALTDPVLQIADVSVAARAVGRSVSNGAPGLLVLAAINFALVRLYPKTTIADREVDAATQA